MLKELTKSWHIIFELQHIYIYIEREREREKEREREREMSWIRFFLLVYLLMYSLLKPLFFRYNYIFVKVNPNSSLQLNNGTYSKKCHCHFYKN